MKQRIAICLVLLCQLSHAQVFDVDTLWYTGPDDKRINLVILGDGYQSAELTQFITDANNFTNKLFLETPYKEYRNYFNVFAIKVPSNESGASHPGTATDVTEPDHPVSTVDNYFGSTFDYFNIHRLLYPTKTATITNVLANNFPTYDVAFMLVNSPYYGGSGGQFPAASTHGSSDEIAIHELGHSFVNLADEYYAGDVYAGEYINMTQETDPNNVKWKNWINENNIGIYQHCCGGNSANWYRPHQNCKMRYLGSDFCSVCIEGTIEEIHDLTDVVDSYDPSNSSTIDLSSATTFSIDLILPEPNTLKIEWTLNGAIIDSNVDSVLISQGDLSAGSNQLVATVEDTTTLLKIDNHATIHVSSVIWDINAATTGIDNISTNTIKIELFPNPVKEVLFFELATETKCNYTVAIQDIAGKEYVVESFNYSDQDRQVQLGELPSGVYVVHFSFDNGVSVSGRIVKE